MTRRQFITSRNGPDQVYGNCSTLPTPRTAEKFTRYRLGPPQTLHVEPMDDATLAKLRITRVRPKSRAGTSLSSFFPRLD
jgi:hypothetical protein